MAEVPLNERFNHYMNDQVDRIESFQEDYEADNDVTLGAYPYAVDGEIITPESNYPDEPKDSPIRIAEKGIHTNVIMEAQQQSAIESEEGLDSYRILQGLDTVSSSTVSDDLVIDGHVSSLDESQALVGQVLTDLEGKDNPTLSKVKELGKTNTLSPSSEENKVNELLQSMDEHYTLHPRPSEQMEELIHQAENEARQLDQTLDRILTLEEQGVENPLDAPSVDDSASLSTESERELLKSLYRNKQQSYQGVGETDTPSNSQEFDI